MRHDRYGLPLSTPSAEARDAYVEAADLFLGGEPGIEAALDRAFAADPGFALAHALAARVHQMHARGGAAQEAMRRALAGTGALTPREQGHLQAIAKVVAGDAAGALAASRGHLAAHPRDALVLMPCVGVFGLFGFSGRAGREAELAAFLTSLAPHYGDDWWFLAALAFAHAETGRLDAARAGIDRALRANPRNANGAHIRAHVDYEAGENAAGLAWLERWHAGYDRAGLMHCHLAWHMALWRLDCGDREGAWRAFDAHVQPGAAWGPPLNVVTDGASFLFRAELAGEARPGERWQRLADYARGAFPQPGLAFVDAHVALACAMAGDERGLAARIAGARGPAGDLVAALGHGFGAFARGEWSAAVAALAPACRMHERLGGSRAQRDLLEYALLAAARHAGQPAERVRTRPLPPSLAGLLPPS